MSEASRGARRVLFGFTVFDETGEKLGTNVGGRRIGALSALFGF